MVSDLLRKQFRFSQMVAKLIQYAHSIGYEVTCGDFYRDPRVKYGHKRSCHRSRLAADLNVFLDGEWQTGWVGHDQLHNRWDALGGAERIENDPNHYSIEYGGMR